MSTENNHLAGAIPADCHQLWPTILSGCNSLRGYVQATRENRPPLRSKMKVTEALEQIKGTRKSICRADSLFNLSFNIDGYLILSNAGEELTPYVLNEFDFNYDWEVK